MNVFVPVTIPMTLTISVLLTKMKVTNDTAHEINPAACLCCFIASLFALFCFINKKRFIFVSCGFYCFFLINSCDFYSRAASIQGNMVIKRDEKDVLKFIINEQGI